MREHTIRSTVIGITAAGCVLSLVVVLLGAWTRLSDAGLGCPDWPGCYGHLAVPSAPHKVAAANARFPDAPLEAHKAWPEMVHRYAATLLGMVALALAALATRRGAAALPRGMMFGLLALVIMQGAFGAWTVTLKLWPQVVTAHLLGGFATASLLWLLLLRLRWQQAAPALAPAGTVVSATVRPLAWVALGALVVQIALGGWTTSNYAALACPDLPTCQTRWWPPMDFTQGFDVLQSVGPNYLGGVLDNEARVAIHMTHRLGALVVLGVALALALALRRESDAVLRRLGAAVAALVCVQFALGVTNVLMTIPKHVATAHNGGALLLLLGLVSVHWRLSRCHPLRR
jgi:cytochrome c oxidase assembly protein subunit 15